MTTDQNHVPWLKLVYDEREFSNQNEIKEFYDKQLNLPFLTHDIMTIIDVSRVTYKSFKNCLFNIKPKWIFDIRVSPRLDSFAGGRAHALREFERMGTIYIDLFGILGVSSYRTVTANPAFWSAKISRLLDGESKSGPYLALLDDAAMMNSVENHLTCSLSHVTGRIVEASRMFEE